MINSAEEGGKVYPELGNYYKTVEMAEVFSDLPRVVRADLTAWFNSTVLNEEDKQLLLNLYLEGRFRAWDCPECGMRVYAGNPDSYNNFQGVWNQDFSYFGNRHKYTEEYINAMCDSCRYRK